MIDPRPLGVFDSGVGGLSILKEIRRQLPNEDLLYLADQAHVPYGPRSRDEIRRFTTGITRFFLAHPVKVIVIACNSASAASLHYLREQFPKVDFVGMEPAVKPAVEQTQTGIIGVIATKATNQGELFASVVARFADGVEVITQACPDFVMAVEKGDFDSPTLRQTAEDYLRPMLDAGIDQLVLGCTHFPFLKPLIQEVTGPGVMIVDPGPAIARQTGRVIEERRNAPDHGGQVRYLTTGSREAFFRVASQLVDKLHDPAQVEVIEWGKEISIQIRV